MGRVATEIEARSLALPVAAKQIGVSAGTLKKHLAGEHVRSDSALKYQDWLQGRATSFKFTSSRSSGVEEVFGEPDRLSVLPEPSEPRLVVDVFSGCGGLSLGFDLLQGGKQFETILAVDLDPSAVRVFNENAQRLALGRTSVGQNVDLTEFSNASEFLAFYVEHAADVREDEGTSQALYELTQGAFSQFRAAVAACDDAFLEALSRIWGTKDWHTALEAIDRDALTQTSVVAFHDRLKLPRPTRKAPALPRTLWAGGRVEGASTYAPGTAFLLEAEREWESEAEKLRVNRQSKGRGQLAVSARRVAAFSAFMASSVFSLIREEWILWRARRSELVSVLFTDTDFCSDLRRLYEGSYPVTVLVGGPPCQGFSRIGRGKIRSLRDAKIHAHGSPEAGDARNLLFIQYVTILEALRPHAFLFENVQHFQSTVRADEADFQATEVLEEAIATVSDGAVAYAVSSAVLNASRCGMPQNRIRYFMCGLREARIAHDKAQVTAGEVLALPRMPEVPLSAALSGLPEPHFVEVGTSSAVEMAKTASLIESRNGAEQTPYLAWIRQPLPGATRSSKKIDSHVARGPRADDAAFFALLGPGRRWMDYRSERSSTIADLRSTFEALAELPDAVFAQAAKANGQSSAFPTREAIGSLLQKLDGSLPLRLLLEEISADLGYDHHLLKDSYLAKRDSQHGDWLARMDCRRPAKTMVSHMSKDTYAFVHPHAPRTLSVREAARIQSFPDWFSFRDASVTEAFKMIGNAVPPFLSHLLATRLAAVLEQFQRPALRLVEPSASATGSQGPS